MRQKGYALTDRWSSWSHSEAFSFPLGFTYRSFITALTWSTDGLFIAISLASTYTCVICEFPSQVPAILRPLFRFDKKPGTETPVMNKTSGSSISLLTYLPIPTNKVSHMTCKIRVIDWNEQVLLQVHFIILIRIFFFLNLRRIYAILFFYLLLKQASAAFDGACRGIRVSLRFAVGLVK